MEKEAESQSLHHKDALAVMKAEYDILQAQTTTELAGIQVEHEAALEALRKDFNKKSTTARLLLNEREEAVRVLTSRVKELEEEIFSGAPQERKIFELAQSQAKREATHGLHKYELLY
jgi:hypothetical protein